MLEWLLGSALPGAAVPPAPPPAVVQAAECRPAYSYTDWEEAWEERRYEDTWVVVYKHYRRSRTDPCTQETTWETKAEGPVRLWRATPHQYTESVSAPKGDLSSSGTPLRTADPPYSFHPVRIGPRLETPESGGSTTAPRQQEEQGEEPAPVPTGFILLAGIVGYLLGSRWLRRSLGLTEAVALGSLLVGLAARTAHADGYDQIPFDARLGPVPERLLEPVRQPEPPTMELPWMGQAIAYLKEGLKQWWPPLAVTVGALVYVVGEPWKRIVSIWDRLRGDRSGKPGFGPLREGGDGNRVAVRSAPHHFASLQPVQAEHPVYTLEGATRDPGMVTEEGGMAEPEAFITELHPDFHPFVPAPEPDPFESALDRGFTLEALYYFGPKFFKQAMHVELSPEEIAEYNRLAHNGLAMGWTLTDVDRADQELRAVQAFIVGFFAGADAYEAESGPESHGAIAGDAVAGFLAYGDIRDLIIQGYRQATGQTVDKATVSFALVGLLMDLGWADGIVPDPADGLNAVLGGLKAAFKRLPAPVRAVFAKVAEQYRKVPDRQAFLKEVREAILWASRNPNTAERMAESGKGLDDLIQVARKTLKPDSDTLARNMLAEDPNLVQKQRYAAHHIVAGNHPDAEEARRILEKFGIEINAAENGVFLPYTRHVMNGEAYHPTLHTRAYFDEVNRRLRDAATREEAFEELRRIADELSKGKVPR